MEQKIFIDASIQGPAPGRTFCYRSGLAVFEETLNGGVLVSAGCNAAGYPLNVLSNCPSRIRPERFSEAGVFEMDINGISVNRGLSFESFEKTEEDGTLHTVLFLRSGILPLRIRVHTVLDGSQMMTRYFELENLSDADMALSRLVLHGGGLETLDLGDINMMRAEDWKKIYSAGYFANDGACREGEFSWRPLEGERLSVCSRFNKDRFRHPVMFVRNNAFGTIYFAQIGWSGGCCFTADVSGQDNRNDVSLAMACEITGYHPLCEIRPGETFTTPAVHFGVVHGGLDDAVQQMHVHVRRSVLCRKEADGRKCLVGAGMGPEHDMSVETTKKFMEQLAQMGAEVFIIDAGWYCPPGREANGWYGLNGINRINCERYPLDALAKLREYAASLGMNFGMWTEIERIGGESGIGKEHPDWFAKDIYGEKPQEGVLDLTVPQAWDWAFSELCYIIETYKLDLLRVDYNTDIRSAFRFRDLGGGTEECLSLRHFQAVYRLYGELKARYPDVIFENCASGGGRTDLGQMQAFNHTWVSDNQRSPRSVEITNGMTMALPPERVDRLFAGMGCHTTGSIDLHMRNVMFTHMSLNVIAPVGAAVNPGTMDFIRHSVDLYKEFIRPMLPQSLVYHHTPSRKEMEQAGHIALEIASPEKDRSAVGVFGLDGSRREHIVYPRGISEGMNYRVIWDNSGASVTMSGADILRKGISVTIPAGLSSELLLLSAE
ncbi:MAG: alpha-galactosidase [Clostridia bacterium]|nr:alpha-galactosidase [Clostridia bacterium]